ncbi:dUTPase [Spiroplasma endosymbiont of Poecilobothrus nobilitatus]|uniref:dUTPase n=1 Tax=Spiroplasma endosymbiont of Poecilobothrus nobilitatus TaxID=1209220 RepID=UPI00313E5202
MNSSIIFSINYSPLILKIYLILGIFYKYQEFSTKLKNDNETFEKRILAFLFELSEFINEQRDFKYWSVKPASAKDILLEEYIHVIHFLISIGNSLTVDFKAYQYHNEILWGKY